MPFVPLDQYADVGELYPTKQADVLDPNYVIAEGDYTELGGGNFSRCGFYSVGSSNGSRYRIVSVRNVCAGGDAVKVLIEESVLFVCPGAMKHSNELAYVCLKGDLITIDPDAFPPANERWYTIVIRCSADCKDMYGRYYKDIAESVYGAVWEEWNG